MTDLVIVSVPGVVTQTPLAAPALLKASVEQAGYSCVTMDYNIRFYQDVADYVDLENYFSTGLNLEQESVADQLVLIWAKELVELNPNYIGISVFTYQNRIATKLLCRHIKQLSSIKIILGGQGLADGGIQGAQGFAKELHQEGLIDHWIRSEGERSLVELLKGNTAYPGIDSDTFDQIDDLDSIPFPDYSDYDLSLYKPLYLPITASRGCVRACTFCDIHEHWQYRFRSGENVAEEIINHHKKYGVDNFKFSDSLVNGSLREFKKFTKIISDYNKTVDNPVKWTGQFIVRSSQQLNERYWQDIADSGGGHLSIGVETGSDVVRTHMNKKFTNQDLDYTMDMLDKYNISCIFLMLIGYPTETEEDHQATLDMFTRYQPMANRIIRSINFGSTLGILPGTPLYKNAVDLGIELDQHENNWVAHNNPTLTLERRIERRSEIKQHVLSLGYRFERDTTEHMLKVLENNLEKFNTRLKLKKLIKIKDETTRQNP